MREKRDAKLCVFAFLCAPFTRRKMSHYNMLSWVGYNLMCCIQYANVCPAYNMRERFKRKEDIDLGVF